MKSVCLIESSDSYLIQQEFWYVYQQEMYNWNGVENRIDFEILGINMSDNEQMKCVDYDFIKHKIQSNKIVWWKLFSQ